MKEQNRKNRLDELERKFNLLNERVTKIEEYLYVLLNERVTKLEASFEEKDKEEEKPKTSFM